MLAPIELLGPLANYFFLRYFGGDKQKELDQKRRYSIHEPEKFRELEDLKKEKNAFWPALEELGNQWLWVVLGCGVLGVGIEEGFRTWH